MICPQGHNSAATDYCDVCGTPMAPAAEPASAPSARPASSSAPSPVGNESGQCPNCGFAATPGALFCENCGYDFTTGTSPDEPSGAGEAAEPEPTPMAEPAPATSPAGESAGQGGSPDPEPPAGPVEPDERASWVAELWIDPLWFAEQTSPEPLPSGGPPVIVPLRSRSVLVGRRSRSRGIIPQVDCGTDSGVSRRQCQLTTDGQRWWVEDLDSANGTFIGSVSGELPTEPIPPGERREIADGERIYIGAWTRLVLRAALPEES